MTGIDVAPGVRKDKSLRILVVHRYYWPDTPPYASMLRRIVGRWYQEGHDVAVLSSQPSYKSSLANEARPRIEIIDNICVERLGLPNETGRPIVRISNAFRLGISLVWRAITRRYDVIMISTSPPVLGGVAAAIAAKLSNAHFIYHCMDIHPEAGKLTGEFSNPLVFQLLRKLDSWACGQAHPVVVLSDDMRATLRKRRSKNLPQIAVLNNFSLPSEEELPAALPFDISKERLTILFAGNIGRFQGLDMVIEAMATLKDRDDIEFIFMGDGVAKAAMQKEVKANGSRVRFFDHQPIEIAKSVMRQVDAGFVSLSPEVYRYAYPSKTMTYLEQGCPLIVAVEKESELAQNVQNEGYGHWVPVEDSQALSKLLGELADDRSWQSSMREKAIHKASTDFSESLALDQWARLIAEFASKKNESN